MKKTIRFFSIALVCLMLLPLLSTLPLKVNATEPVVYEVSNYSELVDALIAHNTSQDPTEIIRLTDDIILESTFTSDVTTDRYVYGTFDGQGHTLYNMTNDISSIIWPYGNSLIENFTVSGKTAPEGDDLGITGQTCIFGDEPTASEIKAGETSIIRNVINERSLTSGVTNYGGFFFRRFNIAGTIRFENCINRGDYIHTSNSNMKLAGYIGYMDAGTVEFVNCSNEGTITSSQSGGFISVYRNGASTIRMINCTNSGTVTGRYSSKCYGVAGGFIGGRDNAGSIGYNVTIEMTNCVNTGDILVSGSGSTKAGGIGGLIGCVGDATSGKNLSINLTNCRVENCTINTNGAGVYAAPLIGRCSPGSVSTYQIEATCCSVSNVNVIGGTARKLIGVASANDSTRPVATACEFTSVTEGGSAVWNENALDSVKCVLMTPYAEIADGEELLEVNFENAPYLDLGLWDNDNYDDLDVAVDGGSVTFTSLATTYKRGIWGADLPATTFPLTAGTKYTVYFTLTMESGMKCAFYPDGIQGIAIIQNSTYTKYQSWSSMSGTEANWSNKTDCGSGLKRFAVEIDYDTGTLTLYGRNINGLYSYINQATGLTFDSDVLGCYFWAGNTAGKSVTVSGVSIEKGLTVEELDKAAIGYTAFQALSDNTLLKTMDFKEVGWNPGFASDSNKGADIEISNDGSSVEFTIHNGDNYRAMWGAPLTDTLPLYDDVQYTFVYDVTFGNENVSVALFPDADNGLVIYGNGTIQWYRWNTQRGGLSQKWNNFTDVDGLTQTFAVAMDYKTEYLYLYVRQSNGTFKYVTRQTCSDPWDAVSNLYCQFRVAGGNKTNPPDATYTVTVSNLKIYKGLNLTDRYVLETAEGAAVRLSNPTGLRFTGYIGKGLLDELKAEYGNANVKVGMLITPTDYLTANSLDFTKEALDGCGSLPAGKKYVKIDASTILESEDGNAYKINCVLSNVLEDNYARKFSAVTYIEVNGSTYYYADYSEGNNARSITYVAEAALLDLSNTQTDEYRYETETPGKYSPYTSAQRSTLEGFRSAESFTIMSYNVEMYDEDSGWEGRNPDKAIETILDYSPDIVGLQEVNQVVEKNWLGQTTKNEGWNSHIATLTSNGYSLVEGSKDSTCWNDLLYKTSKYNKLNSGYEVYRGQLDEEYDGIVDPNGADNDRDKMYRMFTWARLEDKETGKIILAISAHLHYRMNKDDTASTDENAAVRQYEVRLMLAWIADQTFDYDGIVIVGDMNAHYLEAEGGRGRRVIDVYRNEGGFAVARDSAAIKGDIDGTLATTGRTTRPEWIYDYILTRGNVSALSFTVVDNKIDNAGTTYPSDHLPVKATILFD